MTNLLPCPFCGSVNIDPKGWASTDRAGPACDDCGGTADTVELWNSRPLAAPKSAPVTVSPHNSGESDPAVTLDQTGADTPLTSDRRDPQIVREGKAKWPY